MSKINEIIFEAAFVNGGQFVCEGLPVSGYSPLNADGKQSEFRYGEVGRVWLAYEVVSYFDGRIFYAQSRDDAHALAQHIAKSWYAV